MPSVATRKVLELSADAGDVSRAVRPGWLRTLLVVRKMLHDYREMLWELNEQKAGGSPLGASGRWLPRDAFCAGAP
jgi:hypothetical protein